MRYFVAMTAMDLKNKKAFVGPRATRSWKAILGHVWREALQSNAARQACLLL